VSTNRVLPGLLADGVHHAALPRRICSFFPPQTRQGFQCYHCSFVSLFLFSTFLDGIISMMNEQPIFHMLRNSDNVLGFAGLSCTAFTRADNLNEQFPGSAQRCTWTISHKIYPFSVARFKLEAPVVHRFDTWTLSGEEFVFWTGIRRIRNYMMT
jgi:hypothetical protein